MGEVPEADERRLAMTDAIEAGYVEKIFTVLEPLIMREKWSGLVGNEPKGESIIRALPKIYIDAMSAEESRQRVAELERLVCDMHFAMRIGSMSDLTDRGVVAAWRDDFEKRMKECGIEVGA